MLRKSGFIPAQFCFIAAPPTKQSRVASTLPIPQVVHRPTKNQMFADRPD